MAKIWIEESVTNHNFLKKPTMKRKLFDIAIAAVSMCMMVACGSKDASKDKASDKDKAATEQVTEGAVEDEQAVDTAEAEQAITDLVNAVYDDINDLTFAPVMDDEETPEVDFIAKYCSKDFRKLVAKICEIDRGLDSGEGFGYGDEWGAEMWSYFAPPFSVDNIEVDVDGNEGSVSYDLSSNGEEVEMVFRVVREDGEWRFSDCLRQGPDNGSWVERMKEYIEEHQ